MPDFAKWRMVTSTLLFVITLCSTSYAEDRLAEWRQGEGQGYIEYNATHGSSFITISCDIAASEDHSGTSISLEIDGKLLPPNSIVRFVVDDQQITIPSGKSGGIFTSGCAECTQKFLQLWGFIRQGRWLEIIGSNGARAKFSLKGSSRVLPEKPCDTGPGVA